MNSSLLVLRQVATVVLDLQAPDPDVRPIAFQKVPARQVQQAVDDTGKTVGRPTTTPATMLHALQAPSRPLPWQPALTASHFPPVPSTLEDVA